MTALAGGYYSRRAISLEMIVPPPSILVDGPVIIPIAGGDGSLMAEAFCEQVRPLEPFVLAGAALNNQRESQPLTAKAQQSLMALPRNTKYSSLSTHAQRRIMPFAAHVGVYDIGAVRLEAIRPASVPLKTFQRTANHWPLAERKFTASQALVMVEALGAASLGAYLTLVQGVHAVHMNRIGEELEYLTPRYSGTRLSYDEVQAIREADAPAAIGRTGR